MTNAKIGLCTIEFYLPGVASLKEKRSIIKSLLHRVCNQFNVAAAEIDYQDKWQSAVIAFTTVSNSTAHIQKTMPTVIDWIESNYPEAMIVKQETEVI